MKQKSIGRNYLYNLSYQIFLIIIPIIVTPYVARNIGEEGIGRYSFASSVQSYFSLIAALGCNYYAQRVVASHQGNKEQQTIDFWEIFIARIIPFSVAFSVYCIVICADIFDLRYTNIFWILTINIIAVVFDATFFFQGNEEFAKIIFRNVIIKVFSIVCIFIFVKDEDDLLIYVLIQSVSLFLSNISLWFYLPKLLLKVNRKKIAPLKHLRPMLILFLPTIATSVYTSLDKTLIGVITNSDIENGNYEYAEKLVKMSMTILTSLGTVMIPRNSKNFAEGNVSKILENIYNSMRFVFWLGIPLAIGVAIISDNIIPWYLGTVGYEMVANLMKILSPIILIIGLSNVIGVQYLIPSKQDTKFTISIVIGALLNLILNIIFIPKWGCYGAALSTVIAEFIITLVMIGFTCKVINYLKIFYESGKYWISGTVMGMMCWLIASKMHATIINTLIIVLCGCVVYIICLLLLKDKFTKVLFEKIIHLFK